MTRRLPALTLAAAGLTWATAALTHNIATAYAAAVLLAAGVALLSQRRNTR